MVFSTQICILEIFRLQKDGKYIAMDFGIMGTLNEQDKLYLAKNFAAFFKRDYREVARVHIESGWVPLKPLSMNLKMLFVRYVSQFSINPLKIFHLVSFS